MTAKTNKDVHAMRANKIRTIWKAGGAVVNGWLAIPSSFSAEVMAHQGWDSLTVDLQHGVTDYGSAVAMFTAISTTATVPIARVPWLDPGIIMKVLDAGSYGVICPMINSREDAEKFVHAAHYAPMGGRSFGPVRALLYAGADYPTNANETIVTIAQIETVKSLDNLDEILSVKGLDAVYIGPADLSLSLGCAPTFDDVDKPVAEAIDFILAKAKEHGVVACIHNGSTQAALKRIAKGFQLVTIGSDARLMAAGAQDITQKMKAGLDRAATMGTGSSTY
jgi:4-hydroxy-2-oxoheptanedioate aldolase